MFRWLALGRIRGARQARQIAETAGQRQVRNKKKNAVSVLSLRDFYPPGNKVKRGSRVSSIKPPPLLTLACAYPHIYFRLGLHLRACSRWEPVIKCICVQLMLCPPFGRAITRCPLSCILSQSIHFEQFSAYCKWRCVRRQWSHMKASPACSFCFYVLSETGDSLQPVDEDYVGC